MPFPRQSWICAACGMPNPPGASKCRNCEQSFETTTEELVQKHAVTESWIIYIFQLFFIAGGIFFARAIASPTLVGIAIVAVFWWAGLALFACQPVGGEFRRERQYLGRLIDEQTSNAAKLVVRGFFYALYWPIFISKNIYLGLILGAAAIYYAAKYLQP